MAHTNPINVETAPATHNVLKRRVAELESKLAKLNRRAHKLGLPEVGYRVVREFDVAEKHNDNSPTGRVERFVEVEITGTAPRLGGFEFVARIDHVTASQNLVKRAPGCEHTVPEFMRAAPPSCNHCHTNRRRHDTFVLVCVERQTVDGVEFVPGMFTRVGRNCLADFLRSEHADRALNLWTLASECASGLGDPSESDGCGSRWHYYDTRHVLAVTAACVRLDGWTSKAVARDRDTCSTASDVRTVLNPHTRDDEDLKRWRAARRPTAADVETANRIVEFVLSDSFHTTGDYSANLKVLAGDDGVEDSNLGLLCSAIACYRKHVGSANSGSGKIVDEWFGPESGRFEFDATVTNTATFETMYGSKTIVAFVTDDGHRGVWKASGVPDVEVGTRYHVRASVKDRAFYNGRKQTVVTRAKLTPVAA